MARATTQNDAAPSALTADQRKLLRGFVEEIERDEDEIDLLKEDVKGAYEAAAEAGFDVKALKKVIRDRKQEPEQLDLFEQTVAIYRAVVSKQETEEQRRQRHIKQGREFINGPDDPPSIMVDRPFAPPLDA